MIYDLFCPECDWKESDIILSITEKEAHKCPKCASTTRSDLMASRAPPVHLFREGTYEHLTGNTDTVFTSKDQLAREAKRLGKYSEYAGKPDIGREI